MRLPSLISPGGLEELCELAAASPPGCLVEVGVYWGGSAAHLYEVAQRQGRGLFLYDTFAGIPMKGDLDHHEIGEFADTDVALVRAMLPEAQVIVGVFPGSMVPMPPVAFVHLDCDQYESIVKSFAALSPLMVRGGSVLFDDYDALDGAKQAVHDLVGPRGFRFSRCGKAIWTKP